MIQRVDGLGSKCKLGVKCNFFLDHAHWMLESALFILAERNYHHHSE